MRPAIIMMVLLLAAEAYGQNSKRFPVRQNGKWGYIDTSGVLVIPAIYDGADLFNERYYAKVQRGDKVGLIDTSGKVLIEPVYEDLLYVKPQLVQVKKNGLWGICTF